VHVLTVLLLTAFSALRLEGTPTCPSAEAVSARLEQFAAPTGRPPALEDRVARLVEEPEALRIQLLAEDGSVLAERTLSRAGSCEDMAGAAAVIVASLDAALPTAEPKAPVLATERPAATPRRSLSWELGAGAVGSYSSSLTFGLELQGVLGTPAGRLAGRLGLAFLGSRSLELGPGQVRWQRLWLGLGPRVRALPGAVRLDFHAEGLAALLLVSGQGYSVASGAADFDPGAALGVTLSTSIGGLAPWVGLKGIAWFRPQTVSVRGLTETAQLPRFEGLLSLGVSLEGS
jgi:hypothetical protein